MVGGQAERCGGDSAKGLRFHLCETESSSPEPSVGGEGSAGLFSENSEARV